jgi:cysteine desulfurase
MMPIYLDNHATTPLDPRVLDAMMPFLTDNFGNAASASHAYGWNASAAVEKARRQVAELIGAHPDEIVFTSGATESNNAAIKGAVCRDLKPKHVVTSQIEHSSVLDTCRWLKRLGHEITYVEPNGEGIVEVAALERALRPDTVLVSMMIANNEIGTLNPIGEMAKLTRERGILFHCDLVQGAGRLPVDVAELGIDFASLSGHKIYGPKGVGALFARRSAQDKLEPLLHGGGHEHGLRSGTLNVPSIVGFGEACHIIGQELEQESQRVFALRERLRGLLEAAIPQLKINGSLQNRLAGNLNVSFGDIDGESLVLAVQREVAISPSSACASAGHRPSHVLRCLGVPDQVANVRFGIGRFNTAEEIDNCAALFIREIKRLTSE